MIGAMRKMEKLSAQQISVRAWLLGSAGVFVIVMHAIEPERIAQWVPLPTSCGAITGLPCLFCGMTRALHFLANGEFSRALYFNWLAFPIAAGLVLIGALFCAELFLRRRLRLFAPRIRVTGRAALSTASLVASLWLLQVYLAISQHKTELLNPAGPLYVLFVK